MKPAIYFSTLAWILACTASLAAGDNWPQLQGARPGLATPRMFRSPLSWA